jgi:uncharacterized protein Smg (DUF494 family)
MVKMVILQEEIKVVEAEAEAVIMEEVMDLNQEEIRLQAVAEEVPVLQLQLLMAIMEVMQEIVQIL